MIIEKNNNEKKNRSYHHLTQTNNFELIFYENK